jgi:hypothetical protein
MNFHVRRFFCKLEVSMSFLQQRLAAVTDMQLAAIASAADLKSRLSELEELRERVREALEIAGATKVPNWKATVNLRPANI